MIYFFSAFRSTLTGAALNRSDLRSHGMSALESSLADRVVVRRIDGWCHVGGKLLPMHAPEDWYTSECRNREWSKVPKWRHHPCGHWGDDVTCWTLH